MYKKRIGIIFGGRSAEHQVSCKSAAAVIKALNSDKFVPVYIGITTKGEWKTFSGNSLWAARIIENGCWEKESSPADIDKLAKLMDFAFIALHGTYGEDGTVQGLLEVLDIPYCGCGVMASAVAMDKQLFKEIMRQKGLPVCKDIQLSAENITAKDMERVAEELGYPCFVKPANMGSSVGITKAKNRQKLEAAVELAARYDRKIIIEEFIPCRELETAVMGAASPKASEVGEIIPSDEFYDYEAKYGEKSTPSLLKIPAEIGDDEKNFIKNAAVEAYRAIDGYGFARVDFFKDKNTGKIYINEINTIPGFTAKSMFPLLWQAEGMSFSEIIERIIELGNERHHAKNSRQTELR